MTKDAKKYCMTKAVCFYGIPTAVLCTIIYWFLVKSSFSLSQAAADMPLSIFITVFICVLSGVPGFKSDIKKGAAPKTTIASGSGSIYSYLPKATFFQAIWLGLYATFGYLMIFLGLWLCFFPGLVLPRIAYILVKSLLTAVVVALSIYHAAAFSLRNAPAKLPYVQ